MAQILSFNRKERRSQNRNRVQALMRGAVDIYNCDKCGGEFEVIYDNKPDRCPHCNTKFNWKASEEKV